MERTNDLFANIKPWQHWLIIISGSVVGFGLLFSGLILLIKDFIAQM